MKPGFPFRWSALQQAWFLRRTTAHFLLCAALVLLSLGLSACSTTPAREGGRELASRRSHTQVREPLALPTPVFTNQSVLCAVGDAGKGNRGQYQVAKGMLLAGCTHVLYLGDNIYDHGIDPELGVEDPQFETKFERPYRPLFQQLNTIFLVTLGNHDDSGDVDAQVLYSGRQPHWYLPWHTYDLRMGAPGNEICVYSIYVNRLNQVQVQWLRERIQSTSCRWKLVIGHHPIESSGEHGPLAGAGRAWVEKSASLRAALAGADLYLTGHEHSYGDEGNIPTDLAAPSNSTKVRQLVVGTGGASRYLINQHPPANSQHVAIAELGFLKISPTPNQLSWTFFGLERQGRESQNRWDDVTGIVPLHSCGEPWSESQSRPRRHQRGRRHSSRPSQFSRHLDGPILMPCLDKE